MDDSDQNNSKYSTVLQLYSRAKIISGPIKILLLSLGMVSIFIRNGPFIKKLTESPNFSLKIENKNKKIVNFKKFMKNFNNSPIIYEKIS